MGAVILRAQTCLLCSGPMPMTGRVDRRYCKGACRTLAYRLRRRVKAIAPPGPLEPQWAEPSAVVKTMLTALAQIQARVLDFAHQLEGEELYSRRPVRTEEHGAEHAAQASTRQQDAYTQTSLFPSREEPEDKVEQEADGDERGEDEGDVIDELRTLVEQLKSDAQRAEARASVAERDAAALRAELSERRAQPNTSDASLRGRLAETTKQRDRLQAELLTERERSGSLQQRLSSLQSEASTAIEKLRRQQEQLVRDNEQLSGRLRQKESALQRASAALAQWDQIEAQTSQLTAQSLQLQRENERLRDEVARLQPPAAETDPLVVLMKDRAKALHWLAVFQRRAGQQVTGQLLPSYDGQSILEAALRHAFAARRDFYFQPVYGKQPKPRWVFEDRLLDPESEKKVYETAASDNKDIIVRLDSARIWGGDKF
ncbi:MAG: hypothetical protein U1A78_25940 [Polyangia bacterium]